MMLCKIQDDETLKQQLEALRGRPLEDLELEKDIWEECSDKEKLCRNPVVSVHMVTYNHERFIRKALDSVMTQVCDFPFEVVIGEDCSTDKTREICFEYQKRYPDKVRVLYAKENSFRKHGSHLINVWRVSNSARGEIFAWLEGDDYWTDPYKLQKQVAIFREHPEVGLVFAGAELLDAKTNRKISLDDAIAATPKGRIAGRDFFEVVLNRVPWCVYTSTLMWRRIPYLQKLDTYKLKHWALLTADIPLEMIMGLLGDVWFIEDVLGGYRINPSSVSHTMGDNTHLDTLTACFYFSALEKGIAPSRHPFHKRCFRTRLQKVHDSGGGGRKLLKVFFEEPFRRYLLNPLNLAYIPIVRMGSFACVRIGFWAYAKDKVHRLLSQKLVR